MVRRFATTIAVTAALLVAAPSVALACGGFVATLEKGHAAVLRRATTLAAWHGGYEHYITGFRFAGNADAFGYIIPLPGLPSKIEKGGEWTLERLQKEVTPIAEGTFFSAAPASRDGVVVHQEVKIDALDIKIISGGAADLVGWARVNRFGLDADSRGMFEHYTKTGAVFAAAKFDAPLAKEKGLTEGQGTVIHFTIPLSAPWIPLKILSLGKGEAGPVEADLFVLTPTKPVFAPALRGLEGMEVRYSGEAAADLLADLRGDEGMAWVPEEAYLTALTLTAPAAKVGYDLSIDGGRPVGLPIPVSDAPVVPPTWLWWSIAGALLALTAASIVRAQPRTA